MCYKCFSYESKMASILNSIVGSSVGCPLNSPLFPYLKVVGCPLSNPVSCPLYPYMEVVVSLICMAKFPWAAHSSVHWAAHFSSYMEVVGSLNCMAKFPLAANGQPTPLPTELPTFSYLEAVGFLLSYPLFQYKEVVGQPNLHGEIPMSSPRAANSVAYMQPMGSEVCSSLVFFVWEIRRISTQGHPEQPWSDLYSVLCEALCLQKRKWSSVPDDLYHRVGDFIWY